MSWPQTESWKQAHAAWLQPVDYDPGDVPHYPACEGCDAELGEKAEDGCACACCERTQDDTLSEFWCATCCPCSGTAPARFATACKQDGCAKRATRRGHTTAAAGTGERPTRNPSVPAAAPSNPERAE